MKEDEGTSTPIDSVEESANSSQLSVETHAGPHVRSDTTPPVNGNKEAQETHDGTQWVEPSDVVLQSGSTAGAPRPADHAKEPTTQPKHNGPASWLRKHWRHIRRTAKVLALVLTGVIAYYQYLDQSIETNIGREEALFSATASQLDSHSEAVRASALNTLYDLAFTRTPTETPPGPFAPILNLAKWLVYRPEYRNYERCTYLFREFASSPRVPTEADRNLASSQVLIVGVRWMNGQDQMPGITTALPPHWLLDHAQAPQAYAPSLDLRKMQLTYANLRMADLSYSHFEDSDLQHTDASQATLFGAHFDEADMSDAMFQGAHLEFSTLSRSRLVAGHLQLATLNNVRAEHADLDGANLTGAKLKGAYLRGATFRHATLANAELAGADLSDADLSSADLEGADFRYALGLSAARSWKGATIRRALFPPGFVPLTAK